MSTAVKKRPMRHKSGKVAALLTTRWTASAALYIFIGLLAYMPLHIFLSTWLGTSLGILDFAKVAKDIVLVIGFLLAVIASWRKPFFRNVLRDRLIWLIVAFALLNLLLAAFRPTDQEAEILGFVYNVRFLLFFIYAVLLGHLYTRENIIRTATKTVLYVGAVVAIFGILQYLVLPDDALERVGYGREQGVLPAFFIDDKPDLERIMSTVRDPNSLGSYLIIILSLLVSPLLFIREKLHRKKYGLFAALTALALVLTFSRSAWIGAVLALTVLGGLYIRRREDNLIIKRKKLLLAMVAGVLFFTLSSVWAFRDSYFVQNVIFHADESTVLEDPNQLRLRFWRESVEDSAANPLGSGPGTAGLASIRNDVQGTVLNENYYLQILQETGVLGLGLFLAILISVALRIRKMLTNFPVFGGALLASFIGLAFTNLLVHIWANEAVAYTWWGLAGLIAVTPLHLKPKTKTKSQP
jgi:putative inorganic carbon (hco3(-)) transporter